jgi:hypothetical protein
VSELSCIAVRKRMTLCAQKLKMRCAHKPGAVAVCTKLKAMSKPAIYLCTTSAFGDEPRRKPKDEVVHCSPAAKTWAQEFTSSSKGAHNLSVRNVNSYIILVRFECLTAASMKMECLLGCCAV